MLKYIQKFSFMLLFLLTTIQCSQKKDITIQGCYSISTNTECSHIIKSLNSVEPLINSSYQAKFINNSSSGFGNLIKLNRKGYSFAIIPYKFFQDQSQFQHLLKNIQILDKIVFMPLFMVVSDKSPYYSLKDLHGKKIGLGFPNSNTNNTEVINILLQSVIKYTPVYNKEMNFPALLEDKKIDMFVCFSIDCKEVLNKSSQIHRGVRILPIKNIPKTKLEPINITVAEYSGLKNTQTYINTLGTWEYLAVKKGTSEEQVQLITQSLKILQNKN